MRPIFFLRTRNGRRCGGTRHRNPGSRRVRRSLASRCAHRCSRRSRSSRTSPGPFRVKLGPGALWAQCPDHPRKRPCSGHSGSAGSCHCTKSLRDERWNDVERPDAVFVGLDVFFISRRAQLVMSRLSAFNGSSMQSTGRAMHSCFC
jgi:hypothetical protein